MEAPKGLDDCRLPKVKVKTLNHRGHGETQREFFNADQHGKKWNQLFKFVLFVCIRGKSPARRLARPEPAAAGAECRLGIRIHSSGLERSDKING